MKKISNFILVLLSSMAILTKTYLFCNISDLDLTTITSSNVFIIGCLTIFMYILFDKYKDKKVSKVKKILSVVFSIFMVLGECYVTSGTYFILYNNIFTIIITLIKLFGFTYLFKNLLLIIEEYGLKIKNKDIKSNNKIINKYIYCLKKYPFRTSLITILLVFSIYMIAFYPIVLSPDPSFQIKMYFNEHTKYIDWVIQRNENVFMTAHHPILQTYLIGWCIDFGRSVISDNFGLFCYTCIQTLIYASVLAYTIKFASRNNVKTSLLLILLGIYTLVPMYAFYTVSAVKDTLYTAFMILFVLFIFDYVKNYKNKKLSIKYLIYLFFVILLLSLFRNNGIYIVVMTFIFLLLYSKKNFLSLLLTLVIFIASMYSFNKVLIPHLGISDGSPREMYSVPFQQTARLVKYYPNFYKKKERKVIDKILKYKTLGTRYDPELADPVKNKYNKETTSEDMKEYFKLWYKGLVNHLDVYMDATMNNIYGYFYPNTHKWYIYHKYDTRITENDLVDYHYNGLDGLRTFLTNYGQMFPFIPLIGLLSNIAINTWAVFIITGYLVVKKYRKYILSLIPLYGSIIFCVIGPANTYFRYTMPYVFVLPILSILLYNEIRGVSDEKGK